MPTTCAYLHHVKISNERVQGFKVHKWSQGVRCGVGVADGKGNSNLERNNIKDNKTNK